MNTTTLLIAVGQLVLTAAVCYVAFLLRRDAKRSSLVALLTILNELRERNSKALLAILALRSSELFKQGDQQLRAGVMDTFDRLRAIQAAIAEALLCTLRQCDAEWRLAGRLHEAFRSQLDLHPDKDRERLAIQTGTS